MQLSCIISGTVTGSQSLQVCSHHLFSEWQQQFGKKVQFPKTWISVKFWWQVWMYLNVFEVFECWKFKFYQMKKYEEVWPSGVCLLPCSSRWNNDFQILWNILHLHQSISLSFMPDWPKTLKMLCLLSCMWATRILVLPTCYSQGWNKCDRLWGSNRGNKFCCFYLWCFRTALTHVCTHTSCWFSTFLNKRRAVDNIFFSSVLVVFVGQRSSCSDVVFSNKCALWCSTLLRDNTAQAGEFSMATNKTQVLLCQATSDYLNKCQPRNQTLESSSSDPQDKEPIDFPH